MDDNDDSDEEAVLSVGLSKTTIKLFQHASLM